MSLLNVNLLDIVLSFTATMDSVNPELKKHQTRVANIALNIGEAMGLDNSSLFDLIIASRLHDIGVLSSSEGKLLANATTFESEYFHPLAGYNMLKDFDKLNRVAKIILHHHARWDYGRNKFDENGDEIPIEAWIIAVADKIEIFITRDEHTLAQTYRITEKVIGFSEKYAHPDVIEAFSKISKRESFWLDIDYGNYLTAFLDKHKSNVNLCENSLLEFARSFSRIIDYKNKFTATHSSGVSLIAGMMTNKAGYDEFTQMKMSIAGWLHDLGKIAVPVKILEKQAALDREERIIMSTHSYHTYNILSHVGGIADITRWASYHHERLTGNGYPFRLVDEQLDVPSRIMCIADMFVALVEDRPYRKGMTCDEVVDIFKKLVMARSISVDMTDLLLSNYDEMHDALKEQSDATYREFNKFLKNTNSELLY